MSIRGPVGDATSMRLAIIGGTGTLGKGLAIRLSAANQVLIGSRSEEKAESAAAEIKAATGRDVQGGSNEDVANSCDAAILAVPSLDDPGFLDALKAPLKGKIVISPIVPMRFENGFLVYSKATGSAAEDVATVLRESRVAAAFHHVPALTMANEDEELGFDVLVACDNKADYEGASAIVGSVKGLRPLYAGPLSVSRALEQLTPILINTARLNNLRRLSVKLVS
ncbi:MAG: NADPH-dependent F420 reductase [Nitrososphaerota archaeon]|nr:NADPH-dependent F420 reductase [Nitrososphaerota archaeon]